MSSVNAAAVPNLRSSPELASREATQSCHTTDRGFYESYNVLIRVPYISGYDCMDTYLLLERYVPLSSWQCWNDGGNIHLKWDCFYDYGAAINRALKIRYPAVDKFNCPEET